MIENKKAIYDMATRVFGKNWRHNIPESDHENIEALMAQKISVETVPRQLAYQVKAYRLAA